jgi:hypothetical protein
MKRVTGIILSLVLLVGAVIPAWAQTPRGVYVERTRQYRRYDDSRRYERRSDDSFWDEHRDKVTVGIGTGAGAAIGAAAGGKKGALIGALIGAGGSALYTYVLRDRDDDKRYRHRR